MCARRGFDPADVFASYKGVVFVGEPLSPRARALAEEWGVELYEHTGIGDVTAAFECHAHDGLHFWEDTALVEGLDPDGAAPMADGERCELVATSLFNRTAPLIRYRSDDIVRLTHVPCVCGRTHAWVWPIGRKGDEIVVQGRPVLPVDVWAAVESVDACAMGLFQVIRSAREEDALRLRVGIRAGVREPFGNRAGRRARRGRRRARPRSRGRAGPERGAAQAGSAAQDPAGGPAMTETLWGVGSYEDGDAARPLGDLARGDPPRHGERGAHPRDARHHGRHARPVLLDALGGRAVLAAHGRRHAARARSSRAPTPTKATHSGSRCSRGWSSTAPCSA